MPNDPVGDPPVTIDPPEPTRPKLITCGACDSLLHGSGDVKKKSDALKVLELAAAEANTWKIKFEAAQASLDELRTQPEPAPEPARRRTVTDLLP